MITIDLVFFLGLTISAGFCEEKKQPPLAELQSILQEITKTAQASLKEKNSWTQKVQLLRSQVRQHQYELEILKACAQKLTAAVKKFSQEKEKAASFEEWEERKTNLLTRKKELQKILSQYSAEIRQSRERQQALYEDEQTLAQEIASLQESLGHETKKRGTDQRDRLADLLRQSLHTQEEAGKEVALFEQRRLNSLKTRDSFNAAIAGLHSQLEEKRRRLSVLTQTNQLFEKTLTEFTRQTKERSLSLDQLNQLLNAKKLTLDTILGLLSQGAQSEKDLIKISEANSDSRGVAGLLEQLKKAQFDLAQQFTKKKEEKESLMDHLSQLKTRVDEAQPLVFAAKTMRDHFIQQVKEIELRQKGLQNKIGLAQTNQQTDETSRQQLQEIRDQHNSDILAKQAEAKALKEQEQTLIQDRGQKQKEMAKASEDLDKEIESLNTKHSELGTLLTSVQDNFNVDQLTAPGVPLDEKKLQDNIDVLKGENEALQREVIKLRKTKASLQATDPRNATLMKEKQDLTIKK